MKRLLIAVSSLCLFVSLIPGSLVVGAIAQDDTPAVLENSALLAFPRGFDFRLVVESDRVIDRAELRYTVGRQKTINISVADPAPGTIVEFTHPLDLVVNYVPPGVELHYRWHLFSDDQVIMVTDAETLFWMDDRFDWTSYESEDIVMHAYSGDDVFNQQALQVAQETADELEVRFKVTLVEPINFWLYEFRDDMDSALAPNSRDWIGGITLPEFPTISAVLKSGDTYGIERMVSHEVSHQVLYQATENPFSYLANWLDEGIASVVQRAGTEGYDDQVASAYRSGTLPTIQSLIAEWPADREQVIVSYAASYSIVTYILNTWDEEGLGSLLQGYSEGLSHDEALAQAFDVDTQELDTLWRSWIEAGGEQS